MVVSKRVFVAIVLLLYLVVLDTLRVTYTTYTTPRTLNATNVVLLLCTYHEPVRSPMYHDVIRWWLHQSSFSLFVVDSANRNFEKDVENHPRVRTFHFDQDRDFDPSLGKRDPTAYELNALRRWCDTYENWLRNNPQRFVFKLTAKYKLPELESVLRTIPALLEPQLSWIVQHNHTDQYQNSELFGIRASRMRGWIHRLRRMNGFVEMEQRMGALLLSSNTIPFRRLPSLRNLAHYPRNNGSVLTHL